MASPRGSANYLAAIIKGILAKLEIETGLAFTLEFSHAGRTENHPAHIHVALCVPDGRVDEVTEALRRVLAMGYRQRYRNVAVKIETPRSAHWWAAYCVEEYESTAIKLKTEQGRKSRPDYVTQQLTKQAKAFYEDIAVWLNT